MNMISTAVLHQHVFHYIVGGGEGGKGEAEMQVNSTCRYKLELLANTDYLCRECTDGTERKRKIFNLGLQRIISYR